ncbi:acyltransferase [Candidatus Thorarchaeota archaeon]|nr:MAG: acyltransferase [Candidatus Thorarchaeota archaeon]
MHLGPKMSDAEGISKFKGIEDDSEQTEEEQTRPYYFQLDILKALAIAFVVMDHSLTWELKGSIGSLFWERLSIPFFLIVMGFNMGLSFKYREVGNLRGLYTNEYFKRKIIRYVFPFFVLYMISVLLGLFFGYLDSSEYLLLGYLPFWGPGNWFIPLLFGSILIFPAVYWAFKRQPILTIFLCFLSEIILQLIMYIWYPYPINSTLEEFIVSAIRVNVLFFLPAVAIGLWFSGGYGLFTRRNSFIVIYAAVSIIFMLDYTTHFLQNIPGLVGITFTLIDNVIRGDYTFLFYGYSALIVLIIMNTISDKPRGAMQRFIQRIGRASYHILLFQIIWMSIIYWNISQEAVFYREIPEFATILGWSTPLLYVPFYLINLTISFAGGLVWYDVERRVNLKFKSWQQQI